MDEGSFQGVFGAYRIRGGEGVVTKWSVVGDFTWALHKPMVTLPPLAPKSVSSREKNLFSTSLLAAGQKVSPLTGSRDVGAMTVMMLLTLVSQTGPI